MVSDTRRYQETLSDFVEYQETLSDIDAWTAFV